MYNNYSFSSGYSLNANECCLGTGKITILEINEKYNRRTFEFVTGINEAAGILKTVTNGEFYIKRG